MLHRKLNLPKLNHPQHAIMGLGIILVSIVLLCNEYYYFFPPFLAGFLNDDGIGVLGIVLGSALIVWSFRDKQSTRANFWLLVGSCVFWVFEATAEFVHGYVAGRPHMITVGCLEVTIFLFVLSIIGKSVKIKHDKD